MGLFNDFFCGLFDLDGDGKTSLGEEYLAFMSFNSDDSDDCDDDFDDEDDYDDDEDYDDDD